MDKSASEELQKNGYLIIPFPEAVKDRMRQHIRSYSSSITAEDANDLTSSIMRLSEEEFRKTLGTKPYRIFPENISRELNQWSENLIEFLGGEQICISNVSPQERRVNPLLKENSLDAFWRCVRPGKADVGVAHADFQFWELFKGTDAYPPIDFPYDERWKIWVPLDGCVEENSLQVVPHSHVENIPITLRQTSEGIRPDIESMWLSNNEQRFICPFKKFYGCCILFHDRLIHKGAPNNTKTLRISAEWTLLLRLNESPVMTNFSSSLGAAT